MAKEEHAFETTWRKEWRREAPIIEIFKLKKNYDRVDPAFLFLFFSIIMFFVGINFSRIFALAGGFFIFLYGGVAGALIWAKSR